MRLLRRSYINGSQQYFIVKNLEKEKWQSDGDQHQQMRVYV